MELLPIFSKLQCQIPAEDSAITYCCQAHKADQNQRHPSLSSAILSRSCVIWYVSFGCPRFLFPGGLLYHACFGVHVGGILRTWPRYLNVLFNIVDLISSAFVLLSTSSLVINSFHLMFRSLCKHLVWKLASFCSIFVHVTEQ